MIYFYCPAYPYLEQILYLMHHRPPVTIVSGNRDVLRLCEDMGWPFLRFDPPASHPALRTPRLLANVRRFRGELREACRRTASAMAAGEYYFPLRGIDYAGIILLQEVVSRRMPAVYWQRKGHDIVEYRRPRNPLDFARLLAHRFLYRIPLEMGTSSGHKSYYLRAETLDAWGVRRADHPDFENDDPYDRHSFPVTPVGTLIIGSYNFDIMGLDYDLDSYRGVHAAIHEADPRAGFKPHPGVVETEPFFRRFQVLPSHIPVQFWIHSVKLVVSDCSSGMAHFARRGIPCISFLDLLKVHPGNFDRDYWKARIDGECGGRIQFPGTLDALKEQIRKNLG